MNLIFSYKKIASRPVTLDIEETTLLKFIFVYELLNAISPNSVLINIDKT
jgi:hypothetical protein